MKVIFGLGNPGDEYLNTRHNSGFKCIDILAEKFGVNYWKDECGCKVAHVKSSTITLNENQCSQILLACPQSFMNLSGGPVKKLCDKYDISLADIIVVHDDLDILPSKIRIKHGGGNAGHNGLKSIDAKIGTKEYVRVRIGIGHPPGRMPVANFVLARPRGQDDKDWQEGIKLAATASEFLLNHSIEEAQQHFN